MWNRYERFSVNRGQRRDLSRQRRDNTKTEVVLDALRIYYETYNANVHRAAHNLSDKATDAFERSRQVLAHRINAKHAHELFGREARPRQSTLLRHVIPSRDLKQGDEVLISEMEHHSNIVPGRLRVLRPGSLKAFAFKPDGYSISMISPHF
ncbi:MAG: hypothetical protein Ct9H300mP8_06320 [Gammaproteobacteria bacterium]|nr:MAG: hypothetical protein Ct9H300mP8_06320 [Gammaproteobacteria bacterium]